MDLSKLFAGISNGVGNVVHGLENDFSSGVQNFQKQANSLLAPKPQQQAPQQSSLQGQNVPLFVKQQQDNPLGGPLSAQAPEPQGPTNPFQGLQVPTPPQPAQQSIQPPPQIQAQPSEQPQQAMSGQDMLNQTLNLLEGTARSIVNGVGGYLQNKATIAPQRQYVNAKPVDWTSGINTGNGVTDFLAKTAVGIPQSIINAPVDERDALAQTGQDFQSGQIHNLPTAASDVARLALPVATLATLPEGGSALESLGTQGFKEAMMQGGLQGAKYGAGFGAAGAIAGNRNVNDPTQYATNVALGTGEGLGTGALLGGGLAGAGAGVRNMFSSRSIDANDFSQYGKAFATPEGQQALLGKIQQAANDQPQFHSILESGALDTSGRAISNIKSPTSIIGKYIQSQKDGQTDYNLDDVGDVLRGSVVMPNRKLLPQALQTVKDELNSRGWTIDKEQDFFKNPGENNYKGYHVDATSPNGTKTEIQFHDPDSYANARLTHDQYAAFGDEMPAPAKKQIGQLQARIKSDPTAQVEAATRQKELQDTQNTLSPMQTDFSASSAKSPRVMQLQAQRDQLQAARRDPDEFPDQIKQLQAQRDQVKSQLQVSQKTPKGIDKNTRIALRNQTDNLTQRHQDLDTQVKSLQRQHRLNVKDQNSRIDQQTDAIDTQLKDEQGKTAARTFVAQRLRAQQESFAKKSPLASAKVLSDKEKKDAGMPTLRKATLPAGKPGTGNVLMNALGPSIFGRLKNSANAGIRRIAYGVQDAKNWGDFQGQSRAYRLQQLRQDMTPEEKNNSVDVLEGKAQPMSDRVLQWANAADQERDAVFGAAKQTGLKTKYLKNFFPHTYSNDVREQIANDHEYQQAAIKAGKANNEEEAANYLRRTGGRINPQELGSLHEHRLDKNNKYPWIKDPAAMETYLQNAYKEIGYTSAFKPGMTEVTSVLKNQRSNPETNTLKQVLAEAGVTYAPELSPEAQAIKDSTKVLRNINTVTSLTPGATPLSHIPSLGHAATRLSPGDVVKALPTGVKAFFGKFSPEQQQNIARLAVDNSSELYGGGSKMSMFYKAIGLNKTLNVLSAVVHDAAQSRMNWLEQNLQTPEAQRDILKAGLPYQDIAARGSFSPADRYQYVNEALKDSSLELSGLDMPGAAQSSVGKVLFQFSGPEQQAVRRFLPAAGKELLHGNVGRKLAVGTGLATTVGLGMGAVDAKNVLANKPAQTPQQIAMEGAAQGIGIPGSSDIVNSLMYPEYNYATGIKPIDNIPGADTALTAGVNLAGGPLLGKLQNLQEMGQGVPIGQKPSSAQTSMAERTLARQVPYIGPQLANTAFPAASYVGNRPTDVVQALSAGKPIQHGTGNFAYNTNPSVADIFRQNPTVTQQNNKLTQITQTKQQIMGQYNSSDQQMYNTIEGQLQTPYNGTGNELNVKQAYGQLANNPSVLQMKTRIEIANAKFNGTAVNPLWELGLSNPTEQKAMLAYKSYSPADQQTWKKVPANSQMYNDYQAQVSKYYAQNPSAAQSLESQGYSAPAPSANVSKALAAYDASKAAGKPNYALLDNNPEVQQYFAAQDQFDNYVNGLMGLPQTAGASSGSGSGYGSSSSSSSNYLEKELMYQAMDEARSRISVPKVSLAPSKTLQAVQNQKLPSMNLSTGPRGQSIYTTAPKISMATAPKLTHFSLGKGVGKLNVGKPPKIAKQGGGSPGRMQQIKLT